MEIEQSHDGGDNHRPPPAEMTDGVAGEILTQRSRTTLLIINILVLAAGASGGPLMIRLYFLHGGGQKWFSAFLQTTAFPLMLLPVLLSSFGRPRSSPLLRITPPLLLASAVLGLLTGADNFLYSYGASYLPVSTSSLLLSTQLGFTALFAFFIVKQKFAAPSINAVVLLTIGAAVLGVRSSGDRPEGESKAKYYLGFTMMLGAAALYGLVLPVVELTYSKAKQAVSFTLVLEIQFVIAFFATLFCGVGMAVNREFQAIAKEAREYGLGETQYYLVVIFTALITQCFFLGAMGTVNYSSAMLAGIIIALSITITEVLGVFFFHEKFDGEKGVALALSLWGSASYFYGEYKLYRKSLVLKNHDHCGV